VGTNLKGVKSMVGDTVYILWGEWYEDAAYEIFGVFDTSEAAWRHALEYIFEGPYLEESLQNLQFAIKSRYGLTLYSEEVMHQFVSNLDPSECAELVSVFQSASDDVYLHLEDRKVRGSQMATKSN
jgi:hypothetical protein